MPKCWKYKATLLEMFGNFNKNIKIDNIKLNQLVLDKVSKASYYLAQG